MFERNLLLAQTVDAGSVIDITYHSTVFESATNASTFTSTNHPIGTAASDRYVIVCIGAKSTGSVIVVPTVTVAGQSCSPLAGDGGGGSGSGAQIFITDAPVTSGTEATVVITFATNHSRFGAYILTSRGRSDMSLYEAAYENGSSDNSISVSKGHSAGGAIIAMAFDGTTTTGVSWTSGVTEDDDRVIGGRVYSVAHLEYASAGSATVAGSITGGSQECWAIVSF